jgi:hypothetical protein
VTETTWVSKQEAAELLRVSAKTVDRRRRVYHLWQPGIHYVQEDKRRKNGRYLYNKEMLLHWLATREEENDVLHQDAMEAYYASLVPERKKARNRRTR